VSVEDQLSSFIQAQFGYRLDGRELGPDLDLLGEGIIDSMGVMEIVLFAEEAFGVTIDDEDIIPANFRTLPGLSRLVSQKQASTDGQQAGAS
jgi:acyl carrier protein